MLVVSWHSLEVVELNIIYRESFKQRKGCAQQLVKLHIGQKTLVTELPVL